MMGAISLQLLALICLAGAVATVIIVTRNSTKLRQNFFRQLTHFIALPLFFLATSLIGTTSPPKPMDLSKISDTVSAESVRDDLKFYEDQMESYLDYQRFFISLWLVGVFVFSILPAASLAYNYMRHLEKTGANDDKVF